MLFRSVFVYIPYLFFYKFDYFLGICAFNFICRIPTNGPHIILHSEPLDRLDFCRCHFAVENREQDLTILPSAFGHFILKAKPSALLRRLSVGFAVALPPRPWPYMSILGRLTQPLRPQFPVPGQYLILSIPVA